MSEVTALKGAKSYTVLLSFIKYCIAHPQERFWQALRNWSGSPYILMSRYLPPDNHISDTFYFKGKNDNL